MHEYRKQIQPQSDRATDIIANFWINSEPIFFDQLRGYVVLLFFFDYASYAWKELNKYINQWQKRYSDKGLVIIGVHVPEFPFGKKFENVVREMKRTNVNFPIAVDSDGVNSKRYNVAEIPAVFLINRDGLIVYSHFGLNKLWEIEFNIQSLLIKAGYYGDFPIPVGSIYEMRDFIFYRATPDVYMGYAGGSIGNIEGYAPESTINYTDPKIYINGKFYLEGNWFNGKYFIKFGDGEPEYGKIIFPYIGIVAGAVMESTNGRRIKITVLQDENFLSEENAGEDVEIKNGESYIWVEEPRYYEIVSNQDFGEHVLKLIADSESFAIYKFSVSHFKPKWKLITEI